MSLCTVTAHLTKLNGNVLVGATLSFTRENVSGQDTKTIVPQPVDALSDAAGIAITKLFSGNYTGSVLLGTKELYKFSASIPEGDTVGNLYEYINNAQVFITPQNVLDAEAARDAAIAQVVLAADQVILAADQVALAAAQVTLAGAQATASEGSATNAAASAASAASVIQQDLSALNITSTYSPVALENGSLHDWYHAGIIFRQRETKTGWYPEVTTATGQWLEDVANETAARLIIGAGAGSYYHNTTDGKFYSLDAGQSGETEVFRGNKQRFPQQYVVIAEPTRVIILDASDGSMWMVINKGINTVNMWWYGNRPATCLTAHNGEILIGAGVDTWGGLRSMNFLSDTLTRRSAAGLYGGLNIAQRHDETALTAISVAGSVQIVNPVVNAVAITTLPNAPINPATGMPEPTIDVFTAGGLSRINHDGVVADNTSVGWHVGDNNPDMVVGSGAGGNRISVLTSLLVDEAVTQDRTYTASTVPAVMNANHTSVVLQATGKFAVGSVLGLELWEENPAAPAEGMVAYITSKYATGLMRGDIEVALCDGLTDRSVTGTVITDNGTAVIAPTATGAEQKKITATGGTITAPVTTGGKFYGWEYISGSPVFRSGTGWIGVSESGGTLTIADGTTFSMLRYTNGAGPSLGQYAEQEADESHQIKAGTKITIQGTSDAVLDLAYDKITGHHHVLTSWGVTEFNMGVVISSVAGSWDHISAHNGVVVKW